MHYRNSRRRFSHTLNAELSVFCLHSPATNFSAGTLRHGSEQRSIKLNTASYMGGMRPLNMKEA